MAQKIGPKRLWAIMKDLHGDPALNDTRAGKQITKEGEAVYRERYNAGYRYSERGSSLDRADTLGLTDNEAWMDGYLDAATGRDQYHIPFCPDHDACP